LQQRVDLGFGQVGDDVTVELLGWDGQHALDRRGVFGVVQRRVVEQGVHRGEAGVAGAHAVAALSLQVVEEIADQRCVQILDPQTRWRDAGAGEGEGQQQLERVTVGGDGVWAGLTLPDQPVGEERLQGRS
jgi:hypothetical protein